MALDLEDFERRLRASGGAGRGAGAKDDPLAELARLIGEDDPFADLLEAPPGPPPASAVPARKSAPTPRAAEPPTAEARWADADDGHGSSAFDEPSMPQGNRDASPEDEVRFDGATPARRAPARLGRRLAALAIVGLVGIVGAAGLKFTSLSPWPKTAPFIAADSTPVRVPPPKAAPSLDDGAGPSVTAPATPTAKTAAAAKLAKDVEQPVDLGALAKSITGGEVPSQAAADAMFPATQTVQTVSVRPDGSLIAPPAAPTAPDAAAPAVPAPADAAVDLRASAAQDAGTVPAPAAASAPALPSPAPVAPAAPAPAAGVDATNAAPQDLSAGPAPADVAPPPAKVLDSAAIQSGAANAAPDAPAPQPIKFKAKHVGVAVRGQTAAAVGGAPLDLIGQLAAGTPVAKLKKVAAIKPTASPADPVAAADATAPTSGSYSVQFGVRGSDTSAKAAAKSFAGRYASSLGGATMAVMHATVNGKSLYRIRAVGLSRAGATSLCSKIKGAGGSCFVTK